MQRIKSLDSIRGLCIILMIYHHTTFLMYNFGFLQDTFIYNIFVGFLNSSVYFVINLCYVSAFFIIAGITSNFSRNNFKRVIPVIIVAMIITIVTFIIMPNEYIKFGVLHCMALCMVIYALINKFFKSFFKTVPIIVWIVLFIIFYYLYLQKYSINAVGIFGINIPLYIIGLPEKGFMSVDYYPIFPWIFAFFTGASLGRKIKNNTKRPKYYDLDINGVSFVGKYPLIIYAVHQPIAFTILFIADKLIK